MRRDIHGWRLATIDVGSNAVLLLIVEVSLSGTFLVLEECSEVTRIGEGVDQSGLLGECGQNRTMKTLNNYFSLCNDFGVSEVNIVGTSALRASDNAVDFKNRLQMDLGWDLRILSPEEEACYSYLAVQRGLQPGGDEILVVDVGGGSTEFIWGKGGDLFQWASIEMGSVRLTERFFYSDPVTEKECEQLTKAVAEETKNLKSKWKITRPFHLVVGVAGTFTTLATVEKKLLSYSSAIVHGSSLGRFEVQRQIRLYKSKSIVERQGILGLDPGRADVILAGALLVDQIMEIFDLEQIVVSDQGVRYGLLYERLERISGQI